MSVITKELAKDFNVPQKCEQCNKKAEIWWMLHVRKNPKEGINPEHGIANIGFCENHALQLVFGLMRDIDDVQRGRMAKRKAPNREAQRPGTMKTQPATEVAMPGSLERLVRPQCQSCHKPARYKTKTGKLACPQHMAAWRNLGITSKKLCLITNTRTT